MPRYGLDFYRPQLEVVDALVKAAGREALVLVTLYSPFMCAGHSTSRGAAREAPRGGRRGGRARGSRRSPTACSASCASAATSASTASTPRRRAARRARSATRACSTGTSTPCDLRLMRVARRELRLQHPPRLRLRGAVRGPRAVHRLPRARRELQPAPDDRASAACASSAQLFGRPIMGGMDRKGVLATGSTDEVRHEAEAVLRAAPERFILGADCTVPGRGALGGRSARRSPTAHAYRRSAISSASRRNRGVTLPSSW